MNRKKLSSMNRWRHVLSLMFWTVKMILLANAVAQIYVGYSGRLPINATTTNSSEILVYFGNQNVTLPPNVSINAYDFENKLGAFFRLFDALVQIVLAGILGFLFSAPIKLSRKIDKIEEEIYVDIGVIAVSYSSGIHRYRSEVMKLLSDVDGVDLS